MDVTEEYVKNQYKYGQISKRIAANKLKLFLDFTEVEAITKVDSWDKEKH